MMLVHVTVLLISMMMDHPLNVNLVNANVLLVLMLPNVVPVKPMPVSLKTLVITNVNVLAPISMKLLLVLVLLVLINVLLVLTLLITVLPVHLTLTDLILQIVIVIFQILNLKMVMLSVQDVTTDVKNVMILETIVIFVMLPV